MQHTTAALYQAHRATGQAANVALALARSRTPANAPLNDYRCWLVQDAYATYQGYGHVGVADARTAWALAYSNTRTSA